MKNTRLVSVFILVLAAGLSAAIYINSPQASRNYDAGSALPVRWFRESAGSVPADKALTTRLSIWLQTQNATIQIGQNVPVGDGFLNWMIPRTVFGDKMSVGIVREGTSEVLARTQGYFSIIPPTNLQLLSPNGGETFRRGSTINVRWRATDIVPEHRQMVSIELKYYPGGCRVGDPVSVRLPSASLPPIESGDAGYRWTIPETAPVSASYILIVRVQSLEYIRRYFNKGKSDESDRCFSIIR